MGEKIMKLARKKLLLAMGVDLEKNTWDTETIMLNAATRINRLQDELDRRVTSMNTWNTWWKCGVCMFYNVQGYVCANCGHDPSVKDE